MNEYRLPIGTAQKLEMLGAAAGLECVISFLSALEQYAVYGNLPDDIHPFVGVLLGDVIPLNDKARKKAEAGKQGGSMRQANVKQTSSKSEADGKQTVSKPQANAKQERKDEREQKEIPPTPPKEREEKVEKKEGAASFDISDDISHSAVCAVTETSATTPQEPPVITLPLNDGSEFPITWAIVDQLAELYPLIDTMQTLRNIKGWCIGNPKNRKTKRGVMRFVHSWFAKEQDRGSKPAAINSKPRRPTPEETYALPAINPWALPGEGDR